jgi:hypothetical protein
MTSCTGDELTLMLLLILSEAALLVSRHGLCPIGSDAEAQFCGCDRADEGIGSARHRGSSVTEALRSVGLHGPVAEILGVRAGLP